jgi:hypothetical protein
LLYFFLFLTLSFSFYSSISFFHLWLKLSTQQVTTNFSLKNSDLLLFSKFYYCYQFGNHLPPPRVKSLNQPNLNYSGRKIRGSRSLLSFG